MRSDKPSQIIFTHWKDREVDEVRADIYTYTYHSRYMYVFVYVYVCENVYCKQLTRNGLGRETPVCIERFRRGSDLSEGQLNLLRHDRVYE